MRTYKTTLDFINNHRKASGYSGGEIVEFDGFTTAGDEGAGRWFATGNVIAASQTPLALNDIKLSDASGNEFELSHQGIIDLNVLGGTSAPYQTIASNAGLTWSQSFTSIPSNSPLYFATVADMQASPDLSIGDAVIIGERANSLWDIGSYTANGYDILEATASSLQAKLRITGSSIRISQLGALPSTESTANVARAFALASAGDLEEVVLDVSPRPIISSTLTGGRFRIRGLGDSTGLLPTISDGSAVISFPAGTNFLELLDFRIDSGINLANFVSGAIDAQNCIGIEILSGGSNSARFLMKNVTVRGCKEGYNIDGFIGDLDNVWALACETGVIGTQFNSVDCLFRFEECRKDLEITSSNGIHFRQILSEGGQQQSGLVSSTIDGCNGVSFTVPYWEQARNVPFITFGGTTECTGIEINGMSLGSQDGAGNDYDTYLLAFDRVNGLDIKGKFSTGSHHNRYSTTANTKNIRDNTVAASVDEWGPHDASKTLSPTLNYFPNSNFDLWFRGWPNVTFTRCTASKETTIVRKGQNALRLTYTAAQTSPAVGSFVFNDAAGIAIALRGKTITAYAWVWIPNTSDFNPNDLSAQLIQPYLSIFTDGTGGTTVVTGSHHTARGAWNLFRKSTTVPADATRIDVAMNMAINTGSTAGTEFIVVDSVFIVEGNLNQDHKIVNGCIVDSDMNPVKSIGGKMIQRCTSVPTDADMSYEVGDQFWLQTPSAGKYGEIVTTAGTGATKVTSNLNYP